MTLDYLSIVLMVCCFSLGFPTLIFTEKIRLFLFAMARESNNYAFSALLKARYIHVALRMVALLLIGFFLMFLSVYFGFRSFFVIKLGLLFSVLGLVFGAIGFTYLKWPDKVQKSHQGRYETSLWYKHPLIKGISSSVRKYTKTGFYGLQILFMGVLLLTLSIVLQVLCLLLIIKNGL